MNMRHAFVILVVGMWVATPAGFASDSADIFTTKVRPILAQHCFKCHGPDEKVRKAGLRLDRREEALRARPNGRRPIVPGRPDESELVRRIFAHADTERMPPTHAKLPLNIEQKQTLRQWIASGAEYRGHWAFSAPGPVPLPGVQRRSWPRNAVDYFVLAKLEAASLAPAAEADRYTLVRRVYLDLLGLPPTPDEVAAFVRDTAPDAYERLVDRLLGSPYYGERWARRWLDLARYADTNGYEKDRPRSIWPYRDWVIQALNADMPFDQFTIEQLAGDMLPQATREQRIATGFHRNTMLNEEGGIDPLEFRFHAMTDRVATTGIVWLGLTLGCAQCHAHKYDPISQREYYQLLAFMNNADEPTLEVPSPLGLERHRELEGRITQLTAALQRQLPPDVVEARFQSWLTKESARVNRWRKLRPNRATSNLPLLTVQSDDSVFVSGDATKSDTYHLQFTGPLQDITAIRVEALPDGRLPKHGPGRVYYEGPLGDFTLCEFSVTADGRPAKIDRATASFAAGGFTADKAIDGHPQTGWSINGGQGQAHAIVFVFKEPLSAASLDVHMLFERHFAAGLGRFRISVTTAGQVHSAGKLPTEVQEILALPASQRLPDQLRVVRSHFIATAAEFAKEREPLDALRRQRIDYPTTLVFQERPPENPRPTFVHHRGEFLQPKDRVAASTPAFLPALDSKVEPNRLNFARWLVSSTNPLTARVTVNRHWGYFFGRGIVRTTQDFGYQGEAPSHPELLDWLANEFVRSGWSMKPLHRLIVTSATYRQSARRTEEMIAVDPENRLLAAMPRVRLEAEVIRDAALRVSGLLTTKIGGPSVFPPQPPGVTTEGAYGQLQWQVSSGSERYRRGLYTFSKRTTPYAMFGTFDGPSGEVCVARREVSNTPLQALTLLNDVVFMEAAQALAGELIGHTGSLESRLAYIFTRMLTRPPHPEELALLRAYFVGEQTRLQNEPARVAAVAGVNATVERAAWVLLIRSLYNLDEMIVRE